MELNSGLPPEIMVLCTTTETKEQAVRLLEWMRGIPEIRAGLARDRAIPAVCSLIASEQLGNTVVTERRAQQWSQSTPEHFKKILSDVQKLITSSRPHGQTRSRRRTIYTLVEELCQSSALPHILRVEEMFLRAPGSDKWHVKSEHVQAAIFWWTCRCFKIPTARSMEDYEYPAAAIRGIEDLLDKYCSSIYPHTSPPHSSAASLSSLLIKSPTESPVATDFEGPSTGANPLSLEELADEFEVEEDAMDGIRFLEKTVRKKEELRNLVDWDSTLGRCVVFYWACSVLKIPSAKHITLRNQYNLSKRDFDKLLTVLDLHRADLRKKMEEFYAGNPALQLLPQSAQWPATSSANLKSHPLNPAGPVVEKPMSPSRRTAKKGTGRRGRPPKPKSPPPISTSPTSTQEQALIHLCEGSTLRRALVLLRSFNVRRIPASEADRIPPKSLPAVVTLIASQQLHNEQMSETVASKDSHLSAEEFSCTLAMARGLVDSFHYSRELAGETGFDALALEHGLSISAVVSMIHVRECLRDSRCLSTGMDWDSPLVICSVFFWTCAILKVSDVKQSLLRSRSLASKREFDSMLQLLNSHCSVIRHQLEDQSATGAVWLAPPPSERYDTGRRRIPVYGEQAVCLEYHDGTPSKRMKREMGTPSENETDGQPPRRARKPGRPPNTRRPMTNDDSSLPESTTESGDQVPIYRPTVPFPPVDWLPPKSLAHTSVANGRLECPPSESGESKRPNTRYKTLDYEHMAHNRCDAWKPEGEEVLREVAKYQRWVEKMKSLYGPQWEKDINRVAKGTPFE